VRRRAGLTVCLLWTLVHLAAPWRKSVRKIAVLAVAVALYRAVASPRGFEPRSGTFPSENHRLPLKWTLVDILTRGCVAQKCAQKSLRENGIVLYLTGYLLA